MSALAAALLDLGAQVSGSDASASEAARALEERGARIFTGHSASNLGDATHVVLTAAIPPDNPELQAARERGLPIVKRADLLGQLMDTMRGVAVAGTHGKTTTSAMLAWVLAMSGRDPAYMVGGQIRGLGPGGHWGAGSELVAEADEYDRSFLYLHPEVAIITNIEMDHLEYYGSAGAMYAAFGDFAANVKRGGLLILCADDAGASSLAYDLVESAAPFRLQLYGLSDKALWRPEKLSQNSRGGTDYIAVRGGAEIAGLSLQIPGIHNVLNSLAALAACVELGVPVSEAAHRLSEFVGTQRRFEVKGQAGGVTVIDDYAHHPTEISANITAARARYPGRRLVVLFQPHTYTRTRDFLQGFAASLSAADQVVVTEIYASRERDTLGMSGRQIVERITAPQAYFAPTLSEAREILLDDLAPGDLLLTMGAGDVWQVGEEVLTGLQERDADKSLPPPGGRHIPLAEGGELMHEQAQAQRQGSGEHLTSPSVTFRADIASRLTQAIGLPVVRDEPMSKHNSLRIGGPATLFVTVDSVEQLIAAVLFARQNDVPYLVIGNGTNMIVGDYGIDGLVIHNKTNKISHDLTGDATSLWHVDSGVLFSRLARITCDAGWTGLEWSNSVPGSVGGGVVSNAGAHGKELKDDLASIRVLTGEGKIEEWPVDRLQLGYRTSRFKAHGTRTLFPTEVILSASIILYCDLEGQCAARMRAYLQERQATQPQGKSAGSTFKNPPGNSAGYLIEQVGLKGYRCGQAQFSPKHANFMMNLGGATASDVLYLMDLARSRVREQFGIEMEPEIEFINDQEPEVSS